MWVYKIATGALNRGSIFVGTGYSGAGVTLEQGRNNPTLVQAYNIGPIPPGKYRIEPPRDSKTLGPCVFDLTPMPGTETFGRSLFRIHGNNLQNDASHGCIILGPSIRHEIGQFVLSDKPDDILLVIC